MANRFPLIANTAASQIQELASGDFLDLSNSGISNCGNITVSTGSYYIGDGSQLANVVATSVGTLATLSVTDNIVGGNINTAGSISATGNITGSNLNSSNADLAEMYCADDNYPPGTVVEFGGEQEVTISVESHSTRVAGIVSTAPSYLMNSALDCTNALEIALVGRVPCRVVGTIHKGDRLVASQIPGVATVLDPALYQPGCIVGKALESYNSIADGIIEVAVGRI